MACALSLNILVSLVMLVPLWYTGELTSTNDQLSQHNLYFPGYRVHERHSFLTRLLGVTKPEEDESYNTIVKLLIWSNTCTLIFGGAEVGIYYAYAYNVQVFMNFFKNDSSVYV